MTLNTCKRCYISPINEWVNVGEIMFNSNIGMVHIYNEEKTNSYLCHLSNVIFSELTPQEQLSKELDIQKEKAREKGENFCFLERNDNHG